MQIDLEPVTADDWRACAALTVRPEQREFVSEVTYYLCLCHYGGLWHPLAVTVDGQVAAFCMWAVDDDRSRWIGGVVVDRAWQRQGIGRALVLALRDRLAAEEGTPNVALSYSPRNAAARALYLSLGFAETGETEGYEVVARWSVPRVA
ncbi:GNAT family N-acetyltransferase [Actinoplanes sp. NPDC049316]|uniref:GNAT family N-acetyltransferase n=1 Tax=Actinoplanes sp. NPDC049316 TaxID=3154727 RepID=UPI00341B3191